ncbi:hypothetical protein D1970_14660 [Mesobacillus zeae]|uniref:Uncharacterized protein n=1 Tax=Mesobacillus zeae TaxID=1917180 RepID=A0A398B377_9BACI|nr:hypothetical protein D1970_14660 [Mesobacillus zeae]
MNISMVIVVNQVLFKFIGVFYDSIGFKLGSDFSRAHSIGDFQCESFLRICFLFCFCFFCSFFFSFFYSFFFFIYLLCLFFVFWFWL